jgi:hypothetical protein
MLTHRDARGSLREHRGKAFAEVTLMQRSLKKFVHLGLTAVGIALVALALIMVGTRTLRAVPRQEHVLVRDADNPARHGFEAAVDVALPDGFGGNNALLATVPPGKLLVVEHVSAVAFLPPGQKFSAGVHSEFTRMHHLVSTARGSFGSSDLFEISQPIRIYVGPGASLNVRVDRDLASGAGQARFTVSGYLIDQ